MMTKRIVAAIVIFLAVISCAMGQQNVRIKDVASITGLEDIQLYGYGLVVGLAGTGDKTQTIFTEQTITNMLKNLGIDLQYQNSQQIRVRNVAAVMVTGQLTRFKRRGTRFDVTVSSLGDATSLEGGTLILSPIQGPDGNIYASAQGPIATGGYDITDRGLTHIKKNHVLVGRISDGAIVQKEYAFNLLDGKRLSLSLSNPDFTSALSMTQAINTYFNADSSKPLAQPIDAATVSLDYTALTKSVTKNKIGLIEFISKVENVTFNVSSMARVIVNERTGTIVAGGDVRISQVAVNQGGIKVEVVNKPEVVQPQPFSLGRTEVIPNPQTVVEEKDGQMVVLDNTTTVSDLAQALNSLGVSPRDIIAILQAIKQAGALHGQLEIM
jgi:flagellar P-ring protein FlgI